MTILKRTLSMTSRMRSFVLPPMFPSTRAKRLSLRSGLEFPIELAVRLYHERCTTWPDALEALTGSRQMDATAIVEYFAPLKAWLDEQIKGKPVGW